MGKEAELQRLEGEAAAEKEAMRRELKASRAALQACPLPLIISLQQRSLDPYHK